MYSNESTGGMVMSFFENLGATIGNAAGNALEKSKELKDVALDKGKEFKDVATLKTHDICAILFMSIVTRQVFAPILALAQAASQPACPPPITRTS